MNCSRGPVVDEVALVEHLRENPGFRAALDVFEVRAGAARWLLVRAVWQCQRLVVEQHHPLWPLRRHRNRTWSVSERDSACKRYWACLGMGARAVHAARHHRCMFIKQLFPSPLTVQLCTSYITALLTKY